MLGSHNGKVVSARPSVKLKLKGLGSTPAQVKTLMKKQDDHKYSFCQTIGIHSALLKSKSVDDHQLECAKERDKKMLSFPGYSLYSLFCNFWSCLKTQKALIPWENAIIAYQGKAFPVKSLTRDKYSCSVNIWQIGLFLLPCCPLHSPVFPHILKHSPQCLAIPDPTTLLWDLSNFSRLISRIRIFNSFC